VKNLTATLQLQFFESLWMAEERKDVKNMSEDRHGSGGYTGNS
jgi:hypothetical protein